MTTQKTGLQELLLRHGWALEVSVRGTRQPVNGDCQYCDNAPTHKADVRVNWLAANEDTEPEKYREFDCPVCVGAVIPLLNCILDMEGQVDGYIEVPE